MSDYVMERIASFLTYITFGTFGLIWLIFAVLTKKKTGPFFYFNIIQSIILSVFLTAISYIYGFITDIISVIPVIGNIAKSIDFILNQSPLYYGFTLSGLVVMVITIYLCVMSLLGIKPYLPVISNIADTNLGG